MSEVTALNDALWKHYKADRDRKEIEAVALREEVARLTAVNAELTGKLAALTAEKATAAPPEGAPTMPAKAKKKEA